MPFTKGRRGATGNHPPGSGPAARARLPVIVETFRPAERKHDICVLSFRRMRSFHVVAAGATAAPAKAPRRRPAKAPRDGTPRDGAPRRRPATAPPATAPREPRARGGPGPRGRRPVNGIVRRANGVARRRPAMAWGQGSLSEPRCDGDGPDLADGATAGKTADPPAGRRGRGPGWPPVMVHASMSRMPNDRNPRRDLHQARLVLR